MESLEEAGGPGSAEEPEQPASAATSSGEESNESTGDPLADYFVRHKVAKNDTLEGLAVKYNVTVSDIKRANALLADTAMFAKDTLLIPTRPLPIGPEYSTWAGMIVAHYGRLGPADEGAPSQHSPYSHFSQGRALQQLRGYYSTGPSRSQSPQYGSGGDDGDRHHLYAGGGDWGRPGGGRRGAPQQVELMERSSSGAAAASYIEDRLRLRRARGDSQGDEQGPSGSSSQQAGGGAGSSSGGGALSALLHHRPPLFGPEGAALAAAGGQKLRDWKEGLLSKLKKVASQPALAAPPSSAGLQQLGAAAVASAPLGPGSSPARPGVRQRPSSGGGGGGPKAD